MTLTSRPSIYDLAPLEEGGVIARDGFTYQDHVATWLCLRMLNTPDIAEVWCESQDDVTLIWSIDSQIKVEFVQVKSNESDQLWSVANLCKREKTPTSPNGLGTSILERSLAYDRCAETSCFRIITMRDTNADLKLLKYPVGSPDRVPGNTVYARLAAKVEAKVAGFLSENGRDFRYWLDNTTWEVYGTKDDVKKSCIIELLSYLGGVGEYFDPEQVEQKIYEPLLKKVREAAETRHAIDRFKKRIQKAHLVQWLANLLQEIAFSSAPMSVRKMQEKMERAEIPSDAIATAHEMRRRYRQESLNPKFLEPADYDLLQGEIDAALHQLRSKLDAKEIDESVVEFHNRCLSIIQSICTSTRFPNPPPLFFAQGYMYYIVGRCRHRFIRLN